MYKENWNGASGTDKSLEFPNLDLAMKFSKSLGTFVRISDGKIEIVGKFGADSVKDGVLPDGTAYGWTKRRKG